MPDINDFNLSAVSRKLVKKDGTRPSLVWVHRVVNGETTASDYWLKQISTVTNIPLSALKTQIRRNREINKLPIRQRYSRNLRTKHTSIK